MLLLPRERLISLLLGGGGLGGLCHVTGNLLGGGGLDHTDGNGLNNNEVLKKSARKNLILKRPIKSSAGMEKVSSCSQTRKMIEPSFEVLDV